MSAFFLAVNRNKSIFNSDVAQGMMRELAVFGHDQACLVVKDHYALGYQSLWTVPEEVGECQPLSFNNKQDWFMFDGRIDNRNKLFQLLGLNVPQHTLSDAQLIYRFYQAFGKQGLSKIIGPFVFVVFNPTTNDFFAARDGMGGRNLVTKICDDFILISSYEMALVAHPSVDYSLNHSRVARLIARLTEDNVSSLISDVIPLQPGQMLYLKHKRVQGLQREFFYRFDGSTRVILDKNSDYATRFKFLLEQAVERRSRTVGPIGTMLSGGFDSVPMSISLAKILSKKEQALTAFSWVFDVHESVDERRYSSEVCKRFDIEQVCINCDKVWPAFNDSMYINPMMPFLTPYIALHEAALSSAKSKGVRTLMSGVHGDLLYGYGDGILWELFKALRWKDCFIEARSRFSQSSSIFKSVKQYFLRPLPLVANFLEKRRLKQRVTSDLLTDRMLSLLINTSSNTTEQARKSLRPIGYKLVFGGFAGEDIAYGRHVDAQYGIDRRYPFRDRDLCEFMLSIPSDQLSFNSVQRPIVRLAYEQEFSEDMLARKSKTSFYPAIESGINNDKNYEKWFESEASHWQSYVKKCYFEGNKKEKTDINIVRWQCAYYDYWLSACYSKEAIKFGAKKE